MIDKQTLDNQPFLKMPPKHQVPIWSAHLPPLFLGAGRRWDWVGGGAGGLG